MVFLKKCETCLPTLNVEDIGQTYLIIKRSHSIKGVTSFKNEICMSGQAIKILTFKHSEKRNLNMLLTYSIYF